MKTFVMGDIHGAYKALLQCLKRSNFDYEEDTLIQLGDVADGWSQVPECVDELLKVKNLIAIKGNHDEWARQWLNFGQVHPYWLKNGGQTTKDAYICSGKLTDQRHRNFFSYQHNYYIDDQNRLFIHGGFTNSKGPQDEHYPSTLWWDRSLWEMSWLARRDIPEEQIPKKLRLFEEIYIGHTATTTVTTGQMRQVFGKIEEDLIADFPIKNHNLWNLDTGAGYYGRLTIMDVDTKEYWRSDPVQELYKNELGRN